MNSPAALARRPRPAPDRAGSSPARSSPTTAGIPRHPRVGLAKLQIGTRRGRIAALRSELAVHLVTRPGFSLVEAARQFRVSTSGIAKAVARAERPKVH